MNGQRIGRKEIGRKSGDGDSAKETLFPFPLFGTHGRDGERRKKARKACEQIIFYRILVLY